MKGPDVTGQHVHRMFVACEGSGQATPQLVDGVSYPAREKVFISPNDPLVCKVVPFIKLICSVISYPQF